MRLLIQRVNSASVTVDDKMIGQVGVGLLLFVGVEAADEPADVEWLSAKVANLRIFADEDGKMNRSVLDIEGEVLLISQFTLHASTKKGNRPSFIAAASPQHAQTLIQDMAQTLGKLLGRPVEQGQFGADMKVSLVNDGPVTIWMDSRNRQ